MNTSKLFKPVYCVSSFHRSGSSMMMRCIAKSSNLKVKFDPRLDWWARMAYRKGYHPNPNGFYQGDDWQVDLAYFYDIHKGKLVKIVKRSLNLVPKGYYKLIFMTRNPEEIKASMRKFSPFQAWGIQEADVYLYDEILAGTLWRLEKRGDFEILKVNYNDVINNPIKQFEKIKDFGFPIEVSKAASFVDKSLYRMRLKTNDNKWS